MNRRVSYLLCQIGFLVILGCLLPCTQAIADSPSVLTLIYTVCLGPQDLSILADTLSALYANPPNLPIICTNLSVSSPSPFAPYIIQDTITQIKFALINLISKSYQAEISAYNSRVILTDPVEALGTLATTITGKGISWAGR